MVFGLSVRGTKTAAKLRRYFYYCVERFSFCYSPIDCDIVRSTVEAVLNSQWKSLFKDYRATAEESVSTRLESNHDHDRLYKT